MYKIMTIGNKDYKLKLSIRGCIDLEKKLGTNPLNVFIRIQANNNELPSMNELMLILHAMLQPYEHGISIDDTYDLYEQWMDEGHGLIDLMNLFTEVLEVSGFIPKN